MRAARFYGTEDLRVERVEPDPVGETDVRIAVEACGICGSDLQEYEVGPRHTPETEHPRTGERVPVPLGHEFSGTITEGGSAVSDVREGDPVAVNPNIPCRKCRYCEDGMYNVCPDVTAVGFQTGAGGFAENAVVPATQVHRLPDDVALEAGALVEPFAVGHHAVRRSGLRAGDTVGVFGCGPIGLTVVRAAADAGAKRIYVSELNETRRAIADEFGADVRIDLLSTDPVETITDATDGGVDVAFEFAGIGATFNAAVRSTRPGGTITVGSMSDDEIATDLNEIVTAERTVTGTYCYGFPPRSSRSEFDAVIRSLAAGEIDTDAFVTGRIGLEEIVESGFEEFHGGETDHVNILVTP